MAEQYKIRIKLLRNDRPCNQGLKPGTEWVFDKLAPKGICSFAWSALLPFIEVLKYGGSFPWEPYPNVVTQCCPDSLVNNVFEIRREPESPVKAEPYNVTVTLTGKECDGACGYGHKAGDTWEVNSHLVMNLKNICPSAFKNLSDAIMVMRYGGQYPWQSDPDTHTVTCPDPAVRNIFELKRTPKN